MKRSIYIAVLFSLVSLMAWPQSEEYDINGLGLAEGEYLHIINLQQESLKTALPYETSGVFITQVGDYNSVVTTTQAKLDQSTYIQSGNSNKINITAFANEIKQTIQQNGDSNYFQSFGINPELNHSIQVNQTGINQDITVFGNNSMSDKMIINMSGNDHSLIIRNF